MADASLRRAPAAVRALSRVIRWMPVGRYRLVHEARRFDVAPFVGRLSNSLGALAFHCDPRDSVAREVCYTGYYEPQETQLLARILERGDVFVDVGANWGYFSLAAAHLVGAQGRVLAFEPEPRLFDLLRKNLELNELTSVTAHHMAIADRHETLRFAAFDPQSGNWGQSHTVAMNEPSDFECESAALDDVLDEARIAHVRLAKIDVEGAEMSVLAGMRRGLTAARYEYVLLECHPALLAGRGITEQDALSPLLSVGYRLWSVVHTPQLHRAAARRRLTTGELLRPYGPGSFDTRWPHLLAIAPGARQLL